MQSISKRKKMTSLFLWYSYFSSLAAVLLDILPPFLRRVIYRILLARFGKGACIDYKVYMRYFKNIKIGQSVSINRGCQFYTSHSLGKKIDIRDNVIISPNVKFYAARHEYDDPAMPDVAEDIIVEEDCYICADTIVLQGVVIGRGSVIGAGSVVNRNIPPYSLAAGVPCRVIRTLK